MICGANGAGVGPAWTRGEIERPAGEKNMGTWTAAVYTEEQQARLGVDEMGQPVASEAAPEPSPPAPAPAPAPRSNRLDRAAARAGARPAVRGGSDAARQQLEAIRERQAAGRAAVMERARQQQGGSSAGGGAGGRFPAHWGEPPLMQTRDYRPLPGGYGHGSGTLARWIEEKMAADASAPARPDLKTSWPECVGMAGEDAVRQILADRPDLATAGGAVGDHRNVHTVAEGSMLTEDWREDRVRVTVGSDGKVSRAPTVG